jgi:hypothetical protein
MKKVRSGEIDSLLEAISVLKAASKQWSEGYRNDLVRVRLERARAELQDELFEALREARGMPGPVRPKGHSEPKQ